MTDDAWTLWIAWRESEAPRLLLDTARRAPMLVSLPDYLSIIAPTRGDLKGYTHHLRQRASIRRAPEFVSPSALIKRSVTRDANATYAIMLARALVQADPIPSSDCSISGVRRQQVR